MPTFVAEMRASPCPYLFVSPGAPLYQLRSNGRETSVRRTGRSPWAGGWDTPQLWH